MDTRQKSVWNQPAAPGKFEVKRLGAVEHKKDGMAVSSSSYSASNFSGAANRRTGQHTKDGALGDRKVQIPPDSYENALAA
jgi:hypothetical protein